jgi:hypothetical protein
MACDLKGADMTQNNPKPREELSVRRERQRVEGAIAMKEYRQAEEATRRKTRMLREQRLAREAAEQKD